MRSLSRLFVGCIALAATAACSAGPAAAAGMHQHATTSTVTVTAQGLLPAPIVRIPNLSTVVWRNAAATAMQIDVLAASCGWCETVFGFADANGAARAANVPPRGVATLCFHAPGEFPFTVMIDGTTHRGVVQVVGTP